MAIVRQSKIATLVGDTDGVNDIFTLPLGEFLEGTERLFWNGLEYPQTDPERGWAVVNAYTIQTATPPPGNTALELFYQEQDPTDVLGAMATVKVGPYAPGELPGMRGCVGGTGWVCDCDDPECPIYEANCPAGTEVGDLVYVTGPKVSGKYQVDTADPGDPNKMPAMGLVREKTSPTECVFQALGRMEGAVGALDPINGQVLYVGVDGKPTQTAPSPPNLVQPIGALIGTNEVLFNPDWGAGGGGSASGGAGGWIRITDCEVSGGAVSDKVWQDPAQTVLQSCTVSGATVTLHVKSSYPTITAGAGTIILGEAASGGYYSGTIDVIIAGSGQVSVTTITPDDENGPYDTISLTLATPPAILSLFFVGGYPGSQSELKAGDTFQLQGTTDKPADAVQILDFGAMIQSVETCAAGTGFLVTGTIADRGDVTQHLPARVRARDADTGAYGPARDTNELGGTVDGTDLVALNDVYPTITMGSVSYPGVQEALKGAEQAQVVCTISNFDTVQYSSPGGDLAIIGGLTIYQNPKTVERVGGAYNVTTPNFQAVATRAANAAQTTGTKIVQIAAVAAQVNMAFAARLRSGGNDGTTAQDHLIQLQANQSLIEAPTLNEDTGGGTFLGSWTAGPMNWNRYLRVHDGDTKGTYAWQGLVATNLAGIVANTITSGANYVLGGFVARTVTWDAFQTISRDLDVAIADFSKVQAGTWSATGQPSTKYPIGTAPPQVNGYTSEDVAGTKPHNVEWLDTSAAESNTGEAYLYSYEEVV